MEEEKLMEKLWRRRSSGEAHAVPACGKWFKQHPLKKACRLRALENHPDKFKRPKQQQVYATAEMQKAMSALHNIVT